jgi:biopolymer transport protein ExbD
MADIFTIVLVFLLKNISASANGFAAPVEANLPMSVAHEAPAESVRIELSLGSVLVNGRRIASIDQIKQDSGLKLLKDSLDSEHKLKNSTELVLVADKGTPYWAVEGSMEVASTAGFEGFKLMVVEEK